MALTLTDIKSRATDATKWQMLNSFGTTALQFIISIILARLIAPSHFGEFVIIIIINTIAQIISCGGLSDALIRQTECKRSDCNVVFTYSIIVATILYLIIFFIAPYVARYYTSTEISPALRITALVIIINAITLTPNAVLISGLEFKKLAIVNLISVIISGIVAIYSANQNCGIWSLVAQILTCATINLLLTIIIAKFCPRPAFSGATFKPLYYFGSKLMMSGLINTTFTHIYSIIIGKTWNVTQLAFYNKAYNFPSTVVQVPSNVIDTVSLPILSKFRGNNELLRVYYRKLIKTCAFLLFPTCLLIATIAEPLINLLLTSVWIEAAQYMRILAFALMLYPIHALNINLLKTEGRSDLILKLEIIKITAIILTLIVTINFDITAVCFGQIFVSAFALLCNTHYTGKMLNLGFIAQLKDIMPALILSSVAFWIGSLVTEFCREEWVGIITGAITFFLIYISGALLFKFDAVKTTRELLLTTKSSQSPNE